MIQAASFFLALLVATFIVMADPSLEGVGGAMLTAFAIGYVGAAIEDWVNWWEQDE